MQLPVMAPSVSPLETVVTSDGWLLRSTVFSPPRTLAVAVFLPAPEIQASLYVPVALTLARAGVVAVLPTMRPGGYEARWSGRATRDLLELLQKVQREYSNLPVLVGAHSTGCSVLLRGLSPLDSLVQGVFLLAPLWESAPKYARRTASLGMAAPNASSLRRFALALWGRAAGNSSPPGDAARAPCTSMQLGGYVCPRAVLHMHAPLFAAMGERDPLVPPSAVFSAFDRSRDDHGHRTLISIPDADHQTVVRDAGGALRRWLLHLLRALDGAHDT